MGGHSLYLALDRKGAQRARLRHLAAPLEYGDTATATRETTAAESESRGAGIQAHLTATVGISFPVVYDSDGHHVL